MAATGLHISISAEPVFNLGGLTITNSILTSLIVSALLITFALITHSKLKQTNRPSGIQNFAEWVVESLLGLAHSVTDSHEKSGRFLPWIGTFFLFILLNNWLGLFPGVGTIGVTHEVKPTEIHAEAVPEVHAQETAVPEQDQIIIDEEGAAVEDTLLEAQGDATHEVEEPHTTFVPILRPGTADLNTTLALAIISVIVTQFMGIKYGGLGYFGKFINFSSPIMFFVGILELVSELGKIISFAFRLFGNIFAGEVLLVVISFLIPLVVPLPFYGLEVFVGFIQALVFAMLSLVFFNMATQSHEAH